MAKSLHYEEKVQTQSLRELKKENQAASEDIQETKEIEDLKQVENAEPQTEDVEETIETTEEESETEDDSWLKSDDTERNTGFIPNEGAAAVRRKLKAKLSGKDDEISQLKSEIEALKKSNQSTSNSRSLTARPKREDYDFDEDAYDKALDEWHDRRTEERFNELSSKNQSRTQQNAANEQLQNYVNSHYDRAAKLVDSGKVTEESYAAADRVVRETVEGLFPGKGDSVTDSLIATLSRAGDGSDKVFYQLGVNKNKLNEFRQALADDPSGLTASALLGTYRANITTPQKRRSNAPNPARAINGESSGKGPESQLLAKYKKADIGERLKLKRQAKAQGIDTSNWINQI
ncbi:hypothetical protein KAR91_53690 [Candidatus Pacearchaeota archaeon]|nr:hypothetical protein [Candidatus Pacearchaeota archaeon]